MRGLAFGDEASFRTDLGFCIAGFTAPNVLGLDHSGVMYNEPGRGMLYQSSRDVTKAGVGLVFRSSLQGDDRLDAAAQKRVVAEAFAGAGWEVPKLLEAMAATGDLYFDTLCQIKLDSWSAGRVVLLGDAAWCAGPGGGGTGLAMIGAYVLAGELARAQGEYGVAFAAYEKQLRPGAAIGQKQGKGARSFLAPVTEKKIRQRNRVYRMLTKKWVAGIFNRMTAQAANAVPVQDYPELRSVLAAV